MILKDCVPENTTHFNHKTPTIVS